MKKKIIIVSLVLLAGLLFFIWQVQKKEQQEVALHQEWSEKRLPLNVKKERLEQELEDLEQKHQSDTEPKGSSQLVFTNLDERIYSVCYQTMKKYEIPGIMTLSSTQLPGKEGCITQQQFAELVEAGWTTCVQWETGKSVSRWWPALQKELEKLGIEPGKALYFPTGSYNANLDKQIEKMGFTIVINEVAAGQSPLQLNHEDGIWHVGAMGFMGPQPKNWLKDAIAQDANIIYLVNFVDQDKLYNESSFDGMMKSFDDYETKDSLLLGSLEDIREHYRSRITGVDQVQEQKYQEEKAALETELADVKAKIKELDNQYQ